MLVTGKPVSSKTDGRVRSTAVCSDSGRSGVHGQPCQREPNGCAGSEVKFWESSAVAVVLAVAHQENDRLHEPHRGHNNPRNQEERHRVAPLVWKEPADTEYIREALTVRF